MWGVLGLGAFGFQLQEVPSDQRIVTTTRSHSNKVVTDCVAAMDPTSVIKVGGAGNKVSGANISSANLYVYRALSPLMMMIPHMLSEHLQNESSAYNEGDF